MIGDARGGPRPGGQPAQVNGMPTKKSVSTSKLSAKGELYDYINMILTLQCYQNNN